ncbi:MAG: zinc-ribbon domain-containing protein [Clostridiales bacterium]|uniref:zinc-ribbon domain-containing protein n=1 Tax=Flavonifractor porci TaxID=3133422 RepID=UPI0030B32C07|nr:zinc-ribbon domain-containing protein [Clostridiales bacterium]
MYCEHCGTQIPDGSIFCVACGKKQSGGAVTEEPRQDVIPPQEPETVMTQAEPENTPSNDEFDWSTFNPVPEEPVEQVQSEPEPVQQEPQNPWQAAAPQQEARNPWQTNTPRQEAQQNPWQDSQQSAPGWQQSGWQHDAQQTAPGWQQNNWQNGAQQSAPGWQNNQQPGWQNNQQPGWQNGPQQGYQGGWQSAPQQSAYSSPYEERRQPVYHNGRIDYGCPMNWYKFQVYFNMIPTAVIYMIFGLLLIGAAGAMYGYSASMEYYYRDFANVLREPQGLIMMYLPSFIPNPMIMGFGSLVYGIFLMVAWVKMIRLQKGGWSLYLVLSALPTAFVAINMIVLFSQVGQYIPSSYLMEYITFPLIGLAVNVLILILQIIYFKKRSYLFVNR